MNRSGAEQPSVEPTSRADVDPDALLAALVLAPATFARNRFFGLFKQAWAAQTRARAGQLRTIVRHLTNDDGAGMATAVELASASERATLRYEVPALHLARTAVLDPLEVALLRFALMRREHAGSPWLPLVQSLRMTDDDRALVESALAKLSRELPPGGV